MKARYQMIEPSYCQDYPPHPQHANHALVKIMIMLYYPCVYYLIPFSIIFDQYFLPKYMFADLHFKMSAPAVLLLLDIPGVPNPGCSHPLEKGCANGGRRALPNIFKFARKIVKSQPWCKRVGHSIFYHLFSFFSNNIWSISQNAPQQKVSRHITALESRTVFQRVREVSVIIKGFLI